MSDMVLKSKQINKFWKIYVTCLGAVILFSLLCDYIIKYE